jgi:hypothetical protein
MSFEYTTTVRSRKKRSPFFRFWQLRYRVYAVIVMLILLPLLYANDKDIPTNVNVEGFGGYSIVSENILAQQIEINPVISTPFLAADNTDNPDLTGNPEDSATEIIVDGDRVIFLDEFGQIITEKLRRDAGFTSGFISSQPFIDLGQEIRISAEDLDRFEERLEQGVINEIDQPTPLDEIYPRPTVPGPITNLLVYDKYKITVPIIYTEFTDLFATDANGNIDFSQAADTSAIESPVQRKLEQGIVHLAYTPQMGEIGNSYIVGHSSNFSNVDSPYNRVFAPIKEKSQPGETFVIYDRFGRELRFRVFEALKIEDTDVEEAFKVYPDRRVVTLQTSVLGWRDGRYQATHRWLTRGELII